MNNDRPAEYLVSLVRELCKLPQETEWVEFKVNDADPKEIGEQMSALENWFCACFHPRSTSASSRWW